MSALAQEATGCRGHVSSVLIQDPDIDLHVSSTYYRNTHDAAIVPSAIDRHARDHGFYGHPPIDPRTGKPYDYTEDEHFRIKLRPVTEGIANQVVRLSERVDRKQTLVISIDGPSGSGKTTIGQEVTKFLRLRGYESVHISLDLFLRDKGWRSAMEKRVLGQALSEEAKALLGRSLQKMPALEAYYDEESFWDVAAREDLIRQIDRFRRSGRDRQTLAVRDGYDRLTKTTKDVFFELERGMVVIIDGKYANREELARCYDVHYRLYDNPDRTKAKFEMRTRSLSPSTADTQMLFYDVGLVPSFGAYAERTRDAIDWIIDLRSDDWELVRPTEAKGALWETLPALEQEEQASPMPVLVR
jgi:uridine kinase